MMTYPMHVAGLVRDLPICKVTEDFYIGAFIMFGDAELTVACARDLLKLAEELDYDYLLTAEAKSIPLIHEMARQSGAENVTPTSFHRDGRRRISAEANNRDDIRAPSLTFAREGRQGLYARPHLRGGSLHHHARRTAALPRPRRKIALVRPHQG